MIYALTVVKDKILQKCTPPAVFENFALMQAQFRKEMKKALVNGDIMEEELEDLELMQVGEFDNVTGMIYAFDPEEVLSIPAIVLLDDIVSNID